VSNGVSGDALLQFNIELSVAELRISKKHMQI